MVFSLLSDVALKEEQSSSKARQHLETEYSNREPRNPGK
jgi:hypothetical protein